MDECMTRISMESYEHYEFHCPVQPNTTFRKCVKGRTLIMFDYSRHNPNSRQKQPIKRNQGTSCRHNQIEKAPFTAESLRIC